MKDYALKLTEGAPTPTAKKNILREYLQANLLKILHSEHFFEEAAFVGGTALRFLHQIPRYSEDLDFTLHAKKKPNWPSYLKKIRSELLAAGYAVETTYRDTPPIFQASLKFSDLLFEAGLSPHREQILSIKLELDTHPPKGAVLETKVVTVHFPLAFLTHDLPTLFARKIHAVLARGFTKGRDFFDIGFYLSKWKGLRPNFLFLQNALAQTGWKNRMPEESTWREMLISTIEKTDWKSVNRDLENFLERPEDRLIFTKNNILVLLREN